MVEITCKAVVMDIEGTTSAARHVFEVLFPYSRDRMRAWVDAHGDEPATAAPLREVADELGVDPADTDAVVGQLVAWIDADVKAAPLKTLQGFIWEEGYAAGELSSHMFDDVPGALRRWHDAGLPLYIYSSGSIAAQQGIFRHAAGGDLTPLIAGNFDITTAGPKREAASYRAIARSLGIEPSDLLFLSDIQAELDAAREAGWQVVGLLRDGEIQATATADPHVASFDDVRIEGA